MLSGNGARFGRFASAVAAWPAAACLFGLGAASLFLSARFDPATYLELPVLTPVNPLLTLAGALLLAALCLGGARLLGRRPALVRLAVAGAALWVAAVGCVWAVSLAAQPQYDQENIWKMACELARGGTETLAGEYAQAYTQQYGIALVLSLLVRLAGTDAVPSCGILSALCAGACVPALCALTAEFFPPESAARGRAVAACALLCALFLPAPLYTPYVYGTLISPACSLWGVYAAVRLAKGGSRRWLWGLLLFPLATVIYNSALIFAAAACLVLLCEGIRGGRRGLLTLALPGALMLLASLAAPAAVQQVLCRALGLPLVAGIPKSAWVALGIHAQGGSAGPGSWDGSNWHLYWDNGGDTAATDVAAKAQIKQYLAEYRAAPGTALAFFAEKTGIQWLDPWFGCLTMNVTPAKAELTAGPLARALYQGPLLAPVQAMLTALLPVVYIGAGAGCLALRHQNRAAVWPQVLAAAFLGGFLFQLVWESKSRYCLPWVMALLPLAAALPALAGARPARKKNACKTPRDML